MKTWKLDSINALHLELTNACNAGCPQCGRYIDGSPRNIHTTSISLEDFKQWFDAAFLQKITNVLLCGNQGDPILCKDLIPIVRYISECSPNVVINIATNGGVRNAAFWSELGSVLPNNSTVIFGIDGLQDTNHLYRRNVDWHRLMTNVSAFIAAGGRAKWQFILFKHNEHQVDVAKQLASDLGFADFMTLNSSGFEVSNFMPAYSKTGKIEYMLEPATVNRVERVETIKFVERDNYEEHVHNMRIAKTPQEPLTNEAFLLDEEIQTLSKREVDCKALTNQHSIFVNAKGEAGPCCFVHSFLDVTPITIMEFQLFGRHWSLGPDAFNLRTTPLTKIVKNINAIYALPQHVGLDGRVMFCSTICSVHSKIDRIYREDISL